MKRRNKGVLLASTVAAMFMANAALAQESGQMSGQSAQSAQARPVKCAGVNACKGQSACKSATSVGPGKNACKGMGMMVAPNLQQCLARGGYALDM